MSSKIFSEALTSISNKHNQKTFTRVIHHQKTIDSHSASLVRCIENILNHSCRKCHNTLTMGALSFTKSTAITTA